MRLLQQRAGRTSRGTRAYVVRETAEFALLVATLAIAASLVELPVWLLIGLPLGKLLASFLFYVLFLRAALRHRPHVGTARLIGQTARVTTSLRPVGQVALDGEIWSARSADGRSIDRGAAVSVLEISGNTMLVTSADSEPHPDVARRERDWIPDEDR